MSHSERKIELLATSVLMVDRRLRVDYMNPAAEAMFAISQRQAQGLRFEELASNAAALRDGMQRCLNANFPYTEHELELSFAGDRAITVDCTVSPVVDADQVTGLMVELRQVDQHLRISREQSLTAQQETSRALLRNLAHEIKNPLGGLRGAAQLLERELPSAELREYTQVIIGEADRLRNLVDRMLAPVKPLTCRALNVHEVLERVRALALAESANGLSIQQDYDPSIPLFQGDAEQLIQALLNIVRNAAQALEGHGTITLRSRIQRQATIGLTRHKLAVRIDVVDDGPGIPGELGQDIFFPTISGHADGTGLGLSIAQSIVSQHGGLIEYRSHPGETVFSLLLPLETVDE